MDQALFQENERLAPKADQRKLIPIGPLTLESGEVLPDVVVACETWGKLSPSGDNAILVCHALSGDSHCVGWWERMVGPGKAIDPERHFVIGSNCLGGCQGTTGPGTLDAAGRRLGSRFPWITVGDMVEAQARLLDQLGVSRLALVCGGSMGGMQALEWALRFPRRIDRCWMTASCARHSAMQIGFNEAARQAIMRDLEWHDGDFLAGEGPHQGLAVARMIGHLSYLSEQAFSEKFGRRPQRPGSPTNRPETQMAVESYLNYQGDKFTGRFDAGSLVVLSKAIDAFERTDLSPAQCRFLFTSFTTDWLYPSHQSEELRDMAIAAGKNVRFCEFDLPYGHDAFLLDGEFQGAVVREFLGE
jgi:homoserine O-acetyltransferase